jgi:hypothetical protein
MFSPSLKIVVSVKFKLIFSSENKLLLLLLLFKFVFIDDDLFLNLFLFKNLLFFSLSKLFTMFFNAEFIISLEIISMFSLNFIASISSIIF